MITVLGATGNTGGRIVETLRAAGEPVRAVGRDPGRLAARGRPARVLRTRLDGGDQHPAQQPSGPDGAIAWADFLLRWTPSNHLRAITSIAAAVLLLLAISSAGPA